MQQLAESQVYFLLFTVVMLALITLLNVVGLSTGKWLNNVGAIGSLDSGSSADCARLFFVRTLRVGNAFHSERDGAAAGNEEPDFPFDDLLCIWRMRGGVVHGG